MRIFKYSEINNNNSRINFNEDRGWNLNDKEECNSWYKWTKDRRNMISFRLDKCLKNQTYFYFLFEQLYREGDYSI